MNSYLVRWEASIEAETPREAAEKARAMQRDGQQPVFQAFCSGMFGAPMTLIDLGKVEDVWKCQEPACRWQGTKESTAYGYKCPACGGQAYLAIASEEFFPTPRATARKMVATLRRSKR